MYSPQETEKEILNFWKKKKIYEKSRKKNMGGRKFYMMDGPPYATGSIHMGTALNKVLKDIAMRSHRLQGCEVFDRAGYDTHGVPIEFQIEKEIGSKSKQDIEKFGVKKFIEKCKEFATKYIDVMNKEFENLAVWMDFDNPYLTLNNEYIEAIWDTFKAADKKKLLYLGKYPVHICPRCATAVAYNEIEYTKQEDLSVYVKFPLRDKKNTFLIIFTTTPWTLPANTGVMVHPDFIYQEVETSGGEKWIIAKELLPKVMAKIGRGFTPKAEFKGETMKGWEYENPLSKNLKMKLKDSYRVVLSGRYVNLEDGTGLVHCAPGHGKEDYEVGKEAGLAMPSPVDLSGNLTEETGKYSGKKARVVDAEIIEDLEKDGSLVYKHNYTHDYPLCWRCKSPLLMVAQPQWFFKISEIQKKLLNENEAVGWVPDWMKLRMKAWLDGLGDWPVSRKRYWGTPLPIWTCECGEKIVIGSRKELEKLSGGEVKEMHKPEIDEIVIKCKCGKNMKRVSEVLDVWFDSGVSSWAALGYPANKKLFNKFWPADVNIEGKDQIRGWWNSQMILSEIKFGKKAFNSISVHGMILDIGKRKMSKSLGNIISPQEIIEKYGRDYMRYYFAKVSKGEDFSFDEKEFLDIGNFFRMLLNVNTYISQLKKQRPVKRIEDMWILSRFNSTLKKITESYNSYKFFDAVEAIEKFLIFDLSRGYIKMTRERNYETHEVLDGILLGLLKFTAPICPLITEEIWQELKVKKIVKEESVHLSLWPKIGKIDSKLEKEFEIILKIIESGLKSRDEAKIGLKWPLAKAVVSFEKNLDKKLQEIILKLLNVKKLEFIKSKKLKVELDLKMTPELEAEGFAREITRAIQAERKKLGMTKTEKIVLAISTDEILSRMLSSYEQLIKDRVNATQLDFVTTGVERFKNTFVVNIKEKKVEIGFSAV